MTSNHTYTELYDKYFYDLKYSKNIYVHAFRKLEKTNNLSNIYRDYIKLKLSENYNIKDIFNIGYLYDNIIIYSHEEETEILVEYAFSEDEYVFSEDDYVFSENEKIELIDLICYIVSEYFFVKSLLKYINSGKDDSKTVKIICDRFDDNYYKSLYEFDYNYPVECYFVIYDSVFNIFTDNEEKQINYFLLNNKYIQEILKNIHNELFYDDI